MNIKGGYLNYKEGRKYGYRRCCVLHYCYDRVFRDSKYAPYYPSGTMRGGISAPGRDKRSMHVPCRWHMRKAEPEPKGVYMRRVRATKNA